MTGPEINVPLDEQELGELLDALAEARDRFGAPASPLESRLAAYHQKLQAARQKTTTTAEGARR
jgi:hypothetical protein